MVDKWLIRLMNYDNNDMIAAYYTENPEQQLATFYFCQEHNILVYIPNDYENKNYQYNDKEAGHIEEIEVKFGNKETFCVINVWIGGIF